METNQRTDADENAHAEAETSGTIVLAAAPIEGPGEEEESIGEERGPEGRRLSDQDQIDIQGYYADYKKLASIDPNNPALGPFCRPNDWIPSYEDALNMHDALARAQAKQEGLLPSDSNLRSELQPRNIGETAPRTTKDILSPLGKRVGSAEVGTRE